MGLRSWVLKHAYNVFNDQNIGSEATTPVSFFGDIGASYGGARPDRVRLNASNERSIISSIYVRLGIDVASTEMRHVKLDENRRFVREINSRLNDCLNVEANLDQGASAFRQDIAMTLFDVGTVAIVPIETSLNPNMTGGYDILSLRVGRITQWYPQHVRVDLYNEKTGRREEVTLPKRQVAIIENPLFSVMNETNSTLQRLIRKLNLLDYVDEQSSSGKLDIIIQLPYAVKTETKRIQAEQRRQDIEFQLKGSKYGIAYTDGTEKITQLNRPAENNLLGQIEFLTKMLYGQLGLTEEVMNGTATEEAMLNYNNRTIEPVVRAIVEGMRRSFLTKTARSQKQSIVFYRDPFKLVPIGSIAEIADKLARNEVLTANEIRGIIGFDPSPDPKADQLLNSNMPGDKLAGGPPVGSAPAPVDEDDDLTELEAELDKILSEASSG